jgi:hypothetical protein
MEHHFPLVLEEENRTLNDIHKAFRITGINAEHKHVNFRYEGKLLLQYENTVKGLSAPEWNEMFKGRGNFDWRALSFFEDTFKDNLEQENNWKFHYYIIRDSMQKPILATFFTKSIWKDDMLAAADVSATLEKMREENPYHMTSLVLAMGNAMTEGNHMYLDRSNPLWKEAMLLLLEEISGIQDNEKITQNVLRDFAADDVEMKEFLINQGYLVVEMPKTYILDMDWADEEEYFEKIGSFNRYRVRRDASKRENEFIVKIIDKVSDEELNHFYSLYCNVHDNNLALNLFKLPKAVIANAVKSLGWEVMAIYLKDAPDKAICMGYSYLTEDGQDYVTVYLGMDYTYTKSHRIYQQLLYQAIKRAKLLGCKRVRLGLTAGTEKEKFGAVGHKSVIYVQAKDNYTFEAIGSMSVSEKHTKK